MKIYFTDNLNDLLSKLTERRKSWYFSILNISSILLALYFVFTAHIIAWDERWNYLTPLGYIVPDALLQSLHVFILLQQLTMVALLGWICRVFPKYSSTLSIILFQCCISFSIESQYYTEHQPFAVMSVLYVLWAFEFTKEGKLLPRARLPLVRALQPFWLYYLPLCWLVITYTLSGLTKLYYSGFAWGDAYGLQFSLMMILDHPNKIAGMIIESPSLAGLLQKAVLFCELSSILALVSAYYRIGWCLFLCGFHLGSIILFGFEFDFYGNILLATLIAIYSFEFKLPSTNLPKPVLQA